MMILLLLLAIGAALLVPHLLLQRFGWRALSYQLQFSEDEASEGDTVFLIETVCNRKLLPLPWVKAELTTHSALDFAAAQSAVAEETRFVSSNFSLMPYQKIERRWRVTCTRRGIFAVSRAVLVLSDLFGTVELSNPMDVHAEITVLPAVREIAALPMTAQTVSGEMLKNRMLIPDRFAVCGIRRYVPGDALRDISQTASARTEMPMVWQYQETLTPALTVLLCLNSRARDIDAVSDPARLEDAIRLCAAHLGRAAAQGIPVRLLANAEIGGRAVVGQFSTGGEALHGMLRTLAAIPYTIAGRPELLLQKLCDSDSAAILVISPYPHSALAEIAARDDRVLLETVKPA